MHEGISTEPLVSHPYAIPNLCRCTARLMRDRLPKPRLIARQHHGHPSRSPR